MNWSRRLQPQTGWNISFAKLGHEKCKDCEIYEQHKLSQTATDSEATCGITGWTCSSSTKIWKDAN